MGFIQKSAPDTRQKDIFFRLQNMAVLEPKCYKAPMSIKLPWSPPGSALRRFRAVFFDAAVKMWFLSRMTVRRHRYYNRGEGFGFMPLRGGASRAPGPVFP